MGGGVTPPGVRRLSPHPKQRMIATKRHIQGEG